MRRAIVPILMLTLLAVAVSAQTGKDVRLYNLEKEYQKLKTMEFRPGQASALELKLVVENMLSIYGSVHVNEKDNTLFITDTPEMVNDLRPTLKSLDRKGVTAGSNLVSETVPLKHVVANDIIGLVRHKLSKYGTILNYSDQNALVITDIKSKIQEAKRLVSELDLPVPHIQIEVAIAEMNLEDFRKLGINVFQWISKVSSQIVYRKMDGHGTDLAVGLNDGSTHNAPTLTRYNVPATANSKSQTLSARISLSDLINIMDEDGKARVLASPRIVTKNNNMASIQATDVIPFKGTPANAPGIPLPGGTPAMLAGVSLQVLPVIRQDSTINLHLWPSIADLTGWDPSGMPIVFTRSLNTEVAVKNGETFVLGGLRRTEKVNRRVGVPLLKDIPLLRFFFSTKTTVSLEREVLIFVRPSVVTKTDFAEEKEILQGMEKSQQPAVPAPE